MEAELERLGRKATERALSRSLSLDLSLELSLSVSPKCVFFLSFSFLFLKVSSLNSEQVHTLHWDAQRP